jgi:dihydroneopterin triphosphate diphosphatase
LKIPVSTLVVIHTPGLQVLLLERADHPGYWQSVTGSQDAGETLVATATREVAEETGLDARQFVLSDWRKQNLYEIYPDWRHRYAPGTTHNTEHVFGLTLPVPMAIQVASREHLGFVWLPWREAATRCFSWTNREAILELPHRLGVRLDDQSTSGAAVRRAQDGDLPRVARFYTEAGYDGGLSKGDIVLIAEVGGALVGAVRLAQEHGVRVLRGMQVTPAHQHRGVGKALLQRLVELVGSEPCFCLLHVHLIGFYGGAGFAQANHAELPEFLQQRLEQCLAQGEKVVPMVRGLRRTRLSHLQQST